MRTSKKLEAIGCYLLHEILKLALCPRQSLTGFLIPHKSEVSILTGGRQEFRRQLSIISLFMRKQCVLQYTCNIFKVPWSWAGVVQLPTAHVTIGNSEPSVLSMKPSIIFMLHIFTDSSGVIITRNDITVPAGCQPVFVRLVTDNGCQWEKELPNVYFRTYFSRVDFVLQKVSSSICWV
jgi:hypothetical protein